MPVYEFSLVAKVNIRMDGETPEMACANLESLLEDAYMSIPCGGFEIKFGKYPAEVWVQNDKPKLERQMPEGNDPTQTQRMTMKQWMDMCLGRQDGPVEEAEDGAVGKGLPEVNKEELLKKHKQDS